jgi:hypothetical protein
MAIADTITSMQNHTSNAYTMIGYGTDLTGINKNLENLSTSIFNAFLEALRTPDTLFTNIPKKSGNGANITLNDTANAPMRITLGSTALEQETTTGKNKMPYSLYNANDNRELLLKNLVLPSGTYTISFDLESKELGTNTSFQVVMGLYYENISPNDTTLITINSSTTLGRKSVTFTTTDNVILNSASNIRIGLTNYNNGARAKLNNIQIESGSTATTYEPYTGGIPAPNPSYPQDIHTISGSNTIKVCGRNIIGSLVNYRADVDTTTGVVTKSDTGLGRFFDLPLEVDNVVVSFTASDTNRMVALQYDSDGTYLGRIVPPTAPTAGSNWNYHFDLSNSYKSILYISNQSYNNNTNFQIEYGTTASPYEAPTLETKDIDLEDIECGSIGNYENIPIRTSGKNLTNANDLNAPANTNTNVDLGTVDLVAGQKYYYSYDITASSTSTRNTPYLQLIGGNKVYEAIATNYNQTAGRKVWEYTCNTTGTYNVGYWCHTPNVAVTISNIMISTSSDIPYEPYGNGTWYLKKNIGDYIWTGNETTGTGGDNFATMYSNGNICRTITLDTLLKTSERNDIMSKFLQPQANSMWNGTLSGIQTYNNDNKVAMSIPVNFIETYAGETLTVSNYTQYFISYLLSIGFTFKYILATPTYTPITGTLAEQLENVYQKMLSQKGQTTISQINDDLSFNMSVQAIEDLE